MSRLDHLDLCPACSRELDDGESLTICDECSAECCGGCTYTTGDGGTCCADCHADNHDQD